MKTVIKKYVFRALRFIIRPFWGKNVWLVADRSFAAGDNGQAFFEYLQDKPIKSYFIISKKSPDYIKMKKIGNVLNFDSLLQKILICACDIYICSHLDRMKDHVEIKNFFLQHGVTFLDLHTYFNPAMHENIYISAASESEKKALTREPYKISKNQVIVTGMARYDKLYHDEKKKIIWAPTWKKNLAHKSDMGFVESRFFQTIQEVMSDRNFLEELSKYGYTLHLKLHPLLKDKEECFKDMNLTDDDYVKLFAEADMFITDFSSVFFDMAYMKKPIIYFHPVMDEAGSLNSNYPEDYFNMERDGFGEIITLVADLKHTILDYANNNCQMKKIYQNRVEEFFSYTDQNNCKRIYDVIQRIIKE